MKNFYIIRSRKKEPLTILSIDIGRALGLEYQLTNVVNGFRISGTELNGSTTNKSVLTIVSSILNENLITRSSIFLR